MPFNWWLWLLFIDLTTRDVASRTTSLGSKDRAASFEILIFASIIDFASQSIRFMIIDLSFICWHECCLWPFWGSSDLIESPFGSQSSNRLLLPLDSFAWMIGPESFDTSTSVTRSPFLSICNPTYSMMYSPSNVYHQFQEEAWNLVKSKGNCDILRNC